MLKRRRCVGGARRSSEDAQDDQTSEEYDEVDAETDYGDEED